MRNMTQNQTEIPDFIDACNYHPRGLIDTWSHIMAGCSTCKMHCHDPGSREIFQLCDYNYSPWGMVFSNLSIHWIPRIKFQFRHFVPSLAFGFNFEEMLLYKVISRLPRLGTCYLTKFLAVPSLGGCFNHRNLISNYSSLCYLCSFYEWRLQFHFRLREILFQLGSSCQDSFSSFRIEAQSS